MSRIVLAVDGPNRERLAGELAVESVEVVAAVSPRAAAHAVDERARTADITVAAALAGCDALVIAADRRALSSALVAACDAHGVRIIVLTDGDRDTRLVRGLGLTDLPVSAPGWRVAEAITTAAHVVAAPESASSSRVIAVWGPAGAPGRSTLAIELAVELARGGRHVGLVDADSHAPSIALALGLADEGPGFAAACRAAERGGLDEAELTRISAPLGVPDGTVDVLTGINRPARWPELTERRVAAALEISRGWADDIVVDVAAPMERDEEIVSDLDGPHRNAATLATLHTADLIVAVACADPLGMSRFVRGYAELRAVVGTTPVQVIANRLRPGALGIDARGQIRRTLDRFAGIDDVDFLPADPRAADAALLSARPMADAAPRSPVVLGMRRFVGQRILPAAAVRSAQVDQKRERPRTAQMHPQ